MSTLTPNYGLIVPEATDTVAQVRADYATNLGLIDNISGGGGGGGGFDFGAFINTNRIIKAQTAFRSSMTYTATEDCFVMFCIVLGVGATYINIDGEAVSTFYNNQTVGDTQGLYLRNGQTVTVSNANGGVDSHYIVYGLMQGTQGVFSPVIYSDNERLIGIWRDNKPLYQKTIHITEGTEQTSKQYTAEISSLGAETILLKSAILKFGSGGGGIWYSVPYHALANYYSSVAVCKTHMNIDCIGWKYTEAYVTVQYTKTADSAGSGDWNTDGVPTVHYSTSEQVIGTWIDSKPLYQITLEYNGTINPNTSNNFANVASLNIETFVSGTGAGYEVGWGWEQLPANLTRIHYNDTSGYIELVAGAISISGTCYVTITYTKTTD